MAHMATVNAHAVKDQPRAFGAGALDGCLLRIRCVHHDLARTPLGLVRVPELTDHDDPATYHLEYALIGSYDMPCSKHPGDTHAVGISTDFVEADAIDDHYREHRGENVPVNDVDRAYWLIDTYFIDWADTCSPSLSIPDLQAEIRDR